MSSEGVRHTMSRPLSLAFYLVMYAVSFPQTAYATVPSGCVGTFETGVANAVGWIDVGVMLGNGQASAPERFIVEAPDGTVKTYFNGDGLTPPTDIMPIWFASADQFGNYTVKVDGQVCTASLMALAVNGEPPSHSAGPSVTAEPQYESSIGSVFGTLALVTVGFAGLTFLSRQWRQS